MSGSLSIGAHKDCIGSVAGARQIGGLGRSELRGHEDLAGPGVHQGHHVVTPEAFSLEPITTNGPRSGLTKNFDPSTRRSSVYGYTQVERWRHGHVASYPTTS